MPASHRSASWFRAVLVGGLVVAGGGYWASHHDFDAPTDSWQRAVLEAEGLDCAFWCSVQVDEALEDLPGAHVVSVEPATGRVTVDYDPQRQSPEQLAAVVTSRGFETTVVAAALMPRPATASRSSRR